MERVLHQSWQWVRAWVPPGLTAIALVATMIGLWLVMMDPNRSLFANEHASNPAPRIERAPATAGYRQAAADRLDGQASGAAAATLPHAASATECEALQREIDSVSVRVRSAGKSKQGVRFRSRLRELKELHGEECKPVGTPAT